MSSSEVISPVFVSEKINTNFLNIVKIANFISIFVGFKNSGTFNYGEKILELPKKYKFKEQVTIFNYKNIGLITIKNENYLSIASGSVLSSTQCYSQLLVPIFEV